MSEDQATAGAPSPPTTADVLRALSVLVAAARKSVARCVAHPRDDVTLAAQTIATYASQRTSAPRENTGLPCPYCGEKQRAIDLNVGPERVVVRIAKEMPLSELASFARFLRQSAKGG